MREQCEDARLSCGSLSPIVTGGRLHPQYPKHCKILVAELHKKKMRSYSHSFTDFNQLTSSPCLTSPWARPRAVVSSKLTLLLASLTTSVLGLGAGLAIGFLGIQIGLPLALLGIVMIGSVILISVRIFTKWPPHRPGYQRITGYDFSVSQV